MIVEVLCRFSKSLTKEERNFIDEELKDKQLIDPEFDIEAERELLAEDFKSYDYKKASVDLSTAWLFNDVDGKHFSIRFLDGLMFTYKGDYQKFKSIFQQVTGRVIYEFEEV